MAHTEKTVELEVVKQSPIQVEASGISYLQDTMWGRITGDIHDQNDLIDYINQNGGKIDSVSVNGNEVEIVNKNVNIEVPTSTSELNNDSGYVDKNVDNLTNYTKTEELGVLASKDRINYNADIDDLPTIPTKTSDLVNDSEYIDSETANQFQTKEDNQLKTTSKTITGAINELKSQQTQTTTNVSNLQTDLQTTNEVKLNRSNVNTLMAKNITPVVNGDNVYLNVAYKNLDTEIETSEQKQLTLADENKAGLMSQSDFSQIRSNTARIEQLEDKTTRLIYTDKTNPTATEIHNFVVGKGYTAPFSGIAVVVDKTYHIWHYYSNLVNWKDDGEDTVSQFTNETLGTILGSETDGKIFAENDGTASVNGWGELKGKVESNESNIESLNNSKLDKITSTSSARRVYAVNTNGTQTFFNVGKTLATSDTIAVRTNDGTLVTATPISNNDATTKKYVDDGLAEKVGKVSGKSLSTNDFTNDYKNNVDENTGARHSHSNKSILDGITASYTSTEKTKLSGIESGAQKNPTNYVTTNTTQTISTDKTFTGYVKIMGTAADRHLITRGIGGCNQETTLPDDLYINYGQDYGMRVGSSGQFTIDGSGNVNTTGTIKRNGVQLATINEILNLVYPVGSIYLSINNVNPQTYLTGTTWVAWGAGRVPLGMGSNGETNYTTVEQTGGSENSVASHNHTQNSHNHTFTGTQGTTSGVGDHSHNIYNYSSSGSHNGVDYSTKAGSTNRSTEPAGAHSHTYTPSGTISSATPTINNNGTTGGNRQPFITCYMWKRTS